MKRITSLGGIFIKCKDPKKILDPEGTKIEFW
jgi:hypothetical protein